MKPTVIMVSGWAHPARALKPLAERFLGRYEVILLSSMELTDYGESLSAVIRERSAPPVLLGWSMGGLMALDAAARAPESVSGLVLVASTARFCADPAYPHGVPEREVRALSIGVRKNAVQALPPFLQDAARPARLSPQSLQAKLVHAIEFGVDRLCADLDYLRASDHRALASHVRAPTLLVHGSEDRIVPYDAGRWLHAHIPDSEWVAVKNAGHDLPLRQPDLILGETLRFFGERAHT